MHGCFLSWTVGHGHFLELLAVTKYPGLILDNKQMKHASLKYLESGDATGNGAVVEGHRESVIRSHSERWSIMGSVDGFDIYKHRRFPFQKITPVPLLEPSKFTRSHRCKRPACKSEPQKFICHSIRANKANKKRGD